jgi:2-oxoisovalerate dehydrogenase E2 component (dihydrolipoyl transacylase)
MQKDFILPDIGEGIVECEVIEWKIKEGDSIQEDQIIVDVSTDKAIVEIPSMYNGRITKLHYAEGDIAKVHEPLFAIELEGEAAEETTATRAVEEIAQPPAAQESAQLTGDSHKVLTTPAVRKMAREHQLDLATIVGTGKQGRVLKEDILGFLAADKVATPQPSVATAAIVAESVDRTEAIKGVRKIMAERMSEAVSTIPHITYVDEVDVTQLIDFRQNLKDSYGSEELKITLMPLFIKAL